MEDYSLGKPKNDEPTLENLENTEKTSLDNKPKDDDKPKGETKKDDKPKEEKEKSSSTKIDESITNAIEINIIKLTKISNKLSEIDSKEFAEEIKFLKDIEKDFANLFGVKLTKSQKDLLIKYVK